MNITDYKRALGIITKKEAKSRAPKGAQWADLIGEKFWKIDDKNVMLHVQGDTWIPSAMSVDLFEETHFYRLK
jgi:hypothetical protein